MSAVPWLPLQPGYEPAAPSGQAAVGVPITYAEAPRVDHGISVDQVGPAGGQQPCSRISVEQPGATENAGRCSPVRACCNCPGTAVAVDVLQCQHAGMAQQAQHTPPAGHASLLTPAVPSAHHSACHKTEQSQHRILADAVYTHAGDVHSCREMGAASNQRYPHCFTCHHCCSACVLTFLAHVQAMFFPAEEQEEQRFSAATLLLLTLSQLRSLTADVLQASAGDVLPSRGAGAAVHRRHPGPWPHLDALRRVRVHRLVRRAVRRYTVSNT